MIKDKISVIIPIIANVIDALSRILNRLGFSGLFIV